MNGPVCKGNIPLLVGYRSFLPLWVHFEALLVRMRYHGHVEGCVIDISELASLEDKIAAQTNAKGCANSCWVATTLPLGFSALPSFTFPSLTRKGPPSQLSPGTYSDV